MTWHMCLIPPIWLLHLIIRQGRLIPPLLLLLLLLKTTTSRICPSTVRLVIFTTELHGVVTFRVIRMTVARQSLNKAYSVSHQNQKETAQTQAQGPLRQTNTGAQENLTKGHRARKTSARRNARQVPKTHKTNTTNVCAKLLTTGLSGCATHYSD